jgi:SAM-dependent methyltransferase
MPAAASFRTRVEEAMAIPAWASKRQVWTFSAQLGSFANIVPTPGDAAKLPYPDGRFDGAYLVTVSGEIPDKDAALRELHRVLKPRGCLVVGEVVGDPDLIPLGELRRRLERCGFAYDRKIGPRIAYLARFSKGGAPVGHPRARASPIPAGAARAARALRPR